MHGNSMLRFKHIPYIHRDKKIMCRPCQFLKKIEILNVSNILQIKIYYQLHETLLITESNIFIMVYYKFISNKTVCCEDYINISQFFLKMV